MGKPLLFITDGVTGHEINLLDPKAITVNGWRPKMPGLKGGGIYSNSALADGHELVIESYDDVVEDMPLYINGKDPDQIGAVQHNLFDLMRTLRGYFTRKEREPNPVYLGFRPKDQTKIQYALLKNYGLDTTTEGFGHEIKGSLFKPAVMAGTLNLEREHGWRDNPPGTLLSSMLQTLTTPDQPVSGQTAYVSNFRNSTNLTHIYNFDDSAGTFSANFVATAAFTYFPSPVGVNDIVYFGSTDGVFFFIVPYSLNSGTFTATFAYEVWNGAAWIDITTSTNQVTGIFRTTDTISFPGLAAWAKTVINGVNAFWFRVRITAITVWTVNPTNVTYPVYTVKNEYANLSSLNGDLPAFLRINMSSVGSANTDVGTIVNQVMIGGKSRGSGNFTSRLNVAKSNINPVGWTVTYAGGTITSQDGTSVTGDRAGIAFAGVSAMADRVTLEQLDDNRTPDWQGLYQVYLICQQVGGIAGAVGVRLTTEWGGPQKIGDTCKPTRVSQGKEIINLGKLRIPLVGSTTYLGGSVDLKFILQVSASSACSFFMYELVFMPLDEIFICIKDTGPVSATPYKGAMIASRRYEIDAGIIQPECSMTVLNSSFLYGYSLPLEQQCLPPMVEPDRDFRLYFLCGRWPSGETSGTMLEAMPALQVALYAQSRWLGLRGDE